MERNATHVVLTIHMTVTARRKTRNAEHVVKWDILQRRNYAKDRSIRRVLASDRLSHKQRKEVRKDDMRRVTCSPTLVVHGNDRK